MRIPTKRLALAALAAAFAVTLVLFALKPVPGARHYEYAVLLTASLLLIVALYETGPRTFFGPGILVFVMICGLALGTVNLIVLNPEAEVVKTYRTVFEALENGQNPYTAGTIFHDIEGSGPVLGNFNYPPLEIYPYYLAYRVAGTWNLAVLTVTMLVIQALCGLVLILMFPRLGAVRLLPFLPMILLGEIKTTAAMTLLVTALVCWLIKKEREDPRPGQELMIAVLFGLGLTAKFLILPLMAAFYAHQVDAGKRRSIVTSGIDAGVALATAWLMMSPFGVANVLKNTLLFNAIPKERAALTTFYPNVLSGPLAWAGLQDLYPFVAAALLVAAIMVAPRLDVFSAMVTAAVVFLLVAPTPEPQFLPALLFFVVAAQGLALEKERAMGQGRGPRRADAVIPTQKGRPPSDGRTRPGRSIATAPAALGLAAALASPVVAAAPPAASPEATTAPLAFSLSAPPAPRPQTFFVLDLARRPPSPQKPRDASQAPRIGPDPAGTRPRDRPKRWRAWLELGAFSAASTVNYWVSDSFPEDRDFRLVLADQIDRIFLLEGWRFDSNQFSLNWSHILAGAVHYQFGRTNGLSWVSSWLMAMAGSTWWEVVGEPKEVIAINDQIMTGAGAFATGEPWFEIGHFLSHERGALARALSFFNPTVKLNHWLDRNGAAAVDDGPTGWHDFRLFAGARRLAGEGSAAGMDAWFGFDARLLGLAEYRMAGETRRRLDSPYFSEIGLDFASRGGHAEETRFWTKAVTLGRLVQKIDPRGAGHSLTFGLGSAFELFKKRPLADYDANPVPVKTALERLRLDEPRRFTDKLAVLHVAGPVLDWMVFRRDLRLWTTLEAYGDFALVNAFALTDYSRLHDVAGLKTTVFYYGYYYGFGGTASASVRLDWRAFRVEGLASLGAWRSVDVLDRFQAEVSNNAGLRDARTRLRFGAGWTVPRTPVEIFAAVEAVRRRGRLGEVRADRLERKTYAGLSYSF